MIENKLIPQTVVAAAFSVVVGISAGAYGLWPRADSEAPQAAVQAAAQVVPPAPTDTDRALCSARPKSAEYQFKFGDYFSTEGRPETWDRYLKPLAGKPVHYLEVGIFEGRSMIWMLDNVLTHPQATATGIDLVLYPQYLDNLVRSGACEKVRNLKGRSQDLLHTLPKESFDVIYIDGSHLGQDVLVDAVLAFELLKTGGLMVFDDYQWYTEWASDIRPGIAIDSFVTMYRHQLEFVHRDYQLMVRKRAHPCGFNKYRLTPVGGYCYQWVKGELVRPSDKKPVKLLPGEKEIIAEIASSHRFGEIAPTLDNFKARPEFQAMNKRLRLF